MTRAVAPERLTWPAAHCEMKDSTIDSVPSVLEQAPPLCAEQGTRRGGIVGKRTGKNRDSNTVNKSQAHNGAVRGGQRRARRAVTFSRQCQHRASHLVWHHRQRKRLWAQLNNESARGARQARAMSSAIGGGGEQARTIPAVHPVMVTLFISTKPSDMARAPPPYGKMMGVRAGRVVATGLGGTDRSRPRHPRWLQAPALRTEM
jgi:hypothetical protein